MSLPTYPQFVDDTATVTGTTADAAHMNGFVQAQTWVQIGGVPPVPGSGIAVTMPGTYAYIVNSVGWTQFVPVISTILNCGAGVAAQDNYIDLSTTGAYTVSTVAAGAAAPAQAANTVRLCKVTTNSSNTAVVSVTSLCTAFPVNPGQIGGTGNLAFAGNVTLSALSPTITASATASAFIFNTGAGTYYSFQEGGTSLASMGAGEGSALAVYNHAGSTYLLRGYSSVDATTNAFSFGTNGSLTLASALTVSAGGAAITGNGTLSGTLNVGANTGGVGQLAVGTGNFEVLALQNTGTGGTNWTFGVGNNSLAPNELFISRQIAGSINGVGGGVDEALMAFYHDGSGGTNRKVYITNRAGTALTIFDAISGAVTTGGALTVSAGGAAITGNTAVSGTFTATGGITGVPSVRCYNNANISIPNNTLTYLTFNTTRWDVGTSTAQHSIATNTSRLTCQIAGTYTITAHVVWDNSVAPGGVRRIVTLRLNGTTQIAQVEQLPPTSVTGSPGTCQTISTLYQLAVNDYVEVGVIQDSGGAYSVLSLANYAPEFMWCKVG